MRTRIATIAVVSAGVLLAGCSVPVDDAPAMPQVRITELAKPSVALPPAEVLPTADDLAATFGAEGGMHLMGQLVEGGPDVLLQGVDRSEATPLDCVGATYRLQKIVYQDSPVRSVASQSWAGGSFEGPPTTGFFGAVKFATPEDAQQFFAASAQKWRRCNGQTVVLHQPERSADGMSRIADVVVGDTIVSAVVRSDTGATIQRALGVSSDYVVDVEVTGADGGAAEVANLMLHKIG